MIFKMGTGVNPEGNVIPMNLRGTILPSTKAATEERQRLQSMSPRLAGKKPVKVD